MNVVVFYIFIIIGLINTIHLGLYICGANIYDIWQYQRQAKLPLKKSLKRPLVSVIIPAHNEALVIERCLDAVRGSTYRKIEVLVHNDHSADDTGCIVRAYRKKYPNFKLRLVNRRHHAGKAGGVNYCIKRYAKGEFVTTLDADCVLRRDAIKNTVSYFTLPNVVGVAANVRLMDKITALGILQQFEHMIGYRSKKFFTVTNCEFIVGGVASTYRHEILRQVKYYDTDTTTEDIGLSMKIAALGNRKHRIVYGSNVVVMTEGVQGFRALLKQRYRWKMGSLQNLVKHIRLLGNLNPNYSRMLTLYRLPMAFLSEFILILQPAILAYLIYLSIHYHTYVLFVGAYYTITLYVLWTIWPDEHSSWQRKLAMSAYAPLLYGLFYIMDAVQIISIIRCLMNPKQLARRTAHGSTWVSPERSGQKVQFS